MAGAFIWNIVDNGDFKTRKDIYCKGTKIHLEDITEIPINIFTGAYDPLCPYGNSLRLQKELGNCASVTLEPTFNHYDFA